MSPLRFSAERVCIVLLTGIGDVVHGLPVADALKDDDPGRTVVWVAEPAPAGVVRHHPSIDDVIVYRKAEGVRGVLRLWRELGGRGFDLTLNMQRYFKSIFPTLISGAPTRVGMPKDKVRDGVSLVCTHHLADGPWKHTQDLFLDFVEYVGLRRPEPEWRIAFTDDERRAQRTYFGGLDDRPKAAVVLATANPKKDWPAERYPPLVEALEREYGLQVLLVGGPSATERAVAARVAEEADASPVNALGDDVRRLLWLVDGSALTVSPDTGPLHVAHALDVPVVGLFGHTNPWRTGPYRRYRELVIDRYLDPGEEPDPSRVEPRHGRMERITVDDVLQKVELALERYPETEA